MSIHQTAMLWAGACALLVCGSSVVIGDCLRPVKPLAARYWPDCRTNCARRSYWILPEHTQDRVGPREFCVGPHEGRAKFSRAGPESARALRKFARGSPPLLREGPKFARARLEFARAKPSLARALREFVRGHSKFARAQRKLASFHRKFARGGGKFARASRDLARGGPKLARGGPEFTRFEPQ